MYPKIQAVSTHNTTIPLLQSTVNNILIANKQLLYYTSKTHLHFIKARDLSTGFTNVAVAETIGVEKEAHWDVQIEEEHKQIVGNQGFSHRKWLKAENDKAKEFFYFLKKN